MRLPSDGELNKLKASQAESMADICHIYHPSMSSGTYGNSVETLTMASGVACGFYFTNGTIREKGQLLLVDYDVLMRLSATQPVFLGDEVQLVERGNIMVSGTFRPATQPMANEMIQIIKLKRVLT